MYPSVAALVSSPMRLVASLENTTRVPSPLIEAFSEFLSPGVPSQAVLTTRAVPRVRSSDTICCGAPAAKPGTRSKMKRWSLDIDSASAD